MGLLDDAIRDYNAALKLDPKNAGSLYGRGLAKQKKGNTEAGNADIAAAKAIQADIAEEYARYGVTLASVVARAVSPPPTVAETLCKSSWFGFCTNRYTLAEQEKIDADKQRERHRAEVCANHVAWKAKIKAERGAGILAYVIETNAQVRKLEALCGKG